MMCEVELNELWWVVADSIHITWGKRLAPTVVGSLVVGSLVTGGEPMVLICSCSC